jgi:hypothetical protein
MSKKYQFFDVTICRTGARLIAIDTIPIDSAITSTHHALSLLHDTLASQSIYIAVRLDQLSRFRAQVNSALLSRLSSRNNNVISTVLHFGA